MKPYYQAKGITIYQGDSLSSLKKLPSESVQTCVTSPPYWGLRDYGVKGQLGLESTPEEYVSRMVDLFREVRRVLKSDGTLWLNLGDCYATGGGKAISPGGGAQGDKWAGRGMNTKQPKWAAALGPICQPNRMPLEGLKPKDLVGMPWRVAFALQADGWYLRSDIIWHKPNPMPESVTDRPTKSHEYLFLLAKSERYFYDADAILEPFQTNPKENYPARARITGRGEQGAAVARGNDRDKSGGFPPRKGSGNTAKRWGTNETPIRSLGVGAVETQRGIPYQYAEHTGRNRRTVWTVNTRPFKGAHFATFPPKLIEPCILAGSRPGDVVLDPFNGAGTTGLVALQHGREYTGLELNPEYCEMSVNRLAPSEPLKKAA